MPNILNTISGCPLFEDLPEQQLEDVKQIVVEKEYSKG